ncbi:helix-turn-helix transcriptional regulator [Bacillus salipaludis]|uniref:helix-turn-helix transcriptional regulator n=1 Tax=Bacillus salipaludis TaxID=2547811 RepID=UPI003D221CC9
MLTAKELEQQLNICRQTLWRFRKQGLPHHKVSYRVIRYDLVEVLEWLEENSSLVSMKVNTQIQKLHKR